MPMGCWRLTGALGKSLICSADGAFSDQSAVCPLTLG